MLATILLVLLVLIGLLLLVSLFTRKDYAIRREVLIDAPRGKVYAYARLLRNMDHYNVWVMRDPGMKKELRGTDGETGFIYGWDSKKGGAGEQEIVQLTEDREIRCEIRFLRPMTGVSRSDMQLEEAAPGRTLLRWTNASRMKTR